MEGAGLGLGVSSVVPLVGNGKRFRWDDKTQVVVGCAVSMKKMGAYLFSFRQKRMRICDIYI